MAAAGDAPAGIFSGVWSRLHAAASFLRRRGQASSGDGDGEGEEQDEEEEAAVRSRLARRAAAARRLGRKLAFVSFNLEVLVFVYAFWRARRRSLSWRLPAQALPILVVPALATLIYAAFVRFTRTLDLKDKKRLEKLQEDRQQTDGEPRELDQNNQNNVQDSGGVDDASKSLVAADSVPHTPKLRKHRQSSLKKKDDGEADMAWGHSKDFQPAPSGGLRMRRLSSAKSYMSNIGATETSEENTQETPSVSAYSDQHVYYVPANTPEELSAGDGEEAGFNGSWDITDTHSSSSKEYLTSPVVPHNSFCDRYDSRPSEHAVSYLSTAFQDLLVKVNEEHPLSLPEKLEFSPVFVNEAAASPPDDFVSHSSLNDLSSVLSESVPPASETLKMLPAESLKEKAVLEQHTSAALQMYSFTSEEENSTSCAVDEKELLITSDVETYPLPPCSDAAIVNIDTVNPRWSLLLELYGNRFEETESPIFHIPEESTTPVNLKEVLPCLPSVNSIESCLGTPELSSCSQETEKMEVAGSVSFIDDSQELSFLASPEFVVNGGEDAIPKESCELNNKEENSSQLNMEEEALQDPLIVSSTSEQCLKASDVSSCIQDTKAREVPGIVNFVTANPELMFRPSPEVLVEDNEEFMEDKMSDLHLPEQNGLALNIEKEPILDSLVADTAEHLLVTPLYSEEIEITEVHDVVKEGIFESEREEAFNRRNLVVTPSDDDSNTQNLTSDSMPVQFVPNTDIDEALEGGQEALSEPLHQITCHSEGMFLSSAEINNDEVFSSNSNSYAHVVDDEAPFKELSMFQGEMAITSPDTPIFLDEVKSAAIVDSDAASPKFSPIPEVLGGGVEENESSKFHVPGEIRTPFNLEEEVILSPPAVNNGSLLKQLEFICQSAGTPELSLCNQESEEMEVAGSVSFINDSPELSALSSPELVTDGGEDARERGTDEINRKEENATLINLEDEAFQGELVVSATDQCLGTSEFPLSSQDAKMTEGPEVATVSSEFNYPAFPELLTLGDDDLKEDGTSELHLHEQKGLPTNLENPFLDPLVVDTAEDTLFTSELLVCSEEFKMTEVHGVVQEVLCESEDEGAFDHQKHVLTSPDDDGTAQSLISNSISAQLLSDASVKEASQAGQEAPSEDAREKVTDELNTEEENETQINSEDEALQGDLVVSTTEQCLEISEFSVSSQGAKMTEGPEIVSFVTVSPELNYPAFPELHAEGDEDLKEDGMSDLLHEQKSLPINLENEPFLDPLVVDTAEDVLVTSELLICSEEVKLTEVHGFVEEVLSESEDEGIFDHRNLILTSPVDNSTAQSLIRNSISSQFLSDDSVKEASQAGQEATSEPPHESTCHSEAGQEGLTKSEDEMALAPLDSSILLDEVASAENLTDNSESSQPIPDINQIQSLHDHEQPPSETLQEVTSLLEGSHTSSDEGINSEIFSLYSRSSSCVSEINMLETLRGGTSSEPPNDRDLSFDERNPVTFPNMDSTESNTDDPMTAEFILETDMIETLNAAEEATVGSPNEVSSSFLGTFVAPDVINDLTESDKHLDLSSSSFAPVVDVFESLQTGQDFSELQYEDDFTVQETPIFLKEVNVAENDFTETIGDPEDSERTSIVALLDEDSTLQRAYMSPEGVENSLADDCASDLPHTAESQFFSENLSAESQDPLSSEDILVYPDEGSTAENDLGTANSPLCSTEINLAESRGIDQEGTQQHDETMLGSEDIYMVDQEVSAEDLFNNSGSLHIPDVIMADSLQGADIISSEILYDERNPVTFPNMDSTDDPVTAEFILETDMIATLNASEEATAGSLHEDSSNILGTFVAPDVINDMTESDKHLDLPSSRATNRGEETTQKAPSISAYSDQHVYYVPLSTEDDEEFKEDKTSDLHLSEQNDIPFDFEKEPILDLLVADTAEHLLVTPFYVPISTEDDEEFKEDKTSDLHLSQQNDLPFNFKKEPILDSVVADTAENSLVTPLYSEEVEVTEVHGVVKQGTFEPQEDLLSSEETLVYPDEGSNGGNNLRGANSSLRSTEVNLAEPWAVDQEGTQQHDETILGTENNSGSLDIPDVSMADSPLGASSEILYDGMSSFEGTLLSLDGHDSAEKDSPNNSGSVMHTEQINTQSILGLQEGSFKSEDKKEINSISQYEVDTEETTYSSVFAKDKEPKEDGESKDMKEDVEDLDDGHENNSIDTFGAEVQ